MDLSHDRGVLGATVDLAIARRRLACLSQLESFRDFDCAARVCCRGSSQSKETPQIERSVPRLARDVAQSGMADSAWRRDLSEIACNQKTGEYIEKRLYGG